MGEDGAARLWEKGIYSTDYTEKILNYQTQFNEDLMGWLIPIDMADDFKKYWLLDDVNDDWSDYFMFAIWEKDEDEIKIRFE